MTVLKVFSDFKEGNDCESDYKELSNVFEGGLKIHS